MKLQSAIVNFQILKIEYASSKNEKSSRDIEPFAIYSTNGNFLLIAFCRLRDDFRVFRIDYIEKIVANGDTFTQHDMTMQKFFEKYVKK